MRLFLRDGAAERLEVRGHAFVASPAFGDFYHQIAGRDLDGTFSDSGLEEVVIVGNGRTLYFADPDSAALANALPDSVPAPLPQANRAACSEILMRLDSSGLSTITLLQGPLWRLCRFGGVGGKSYCRSTGCREPSRVVPSRPAGLCTNALDEGR